MYDKYKEIIDIFDIKKNEKLWISSELLRIVIKWKSMGLEMDANILIDEFQRAVGDGGTILIPTFCFEFSNKGKYDYNHSRGTTGALGNIALSRKDFLRTQHPMHSFAVWGKDQKMLIELDNKHSFGDDSPFGYCLNSDVRQIVLNTDYQHALTFVHYAETKCRVPYRFDKTFTGIYVDKNGKESVRTYDYAARKLELEPTEKMNRIGEILEKLQIAETTMHDGISYRSIYLAKAFPVICNDINCCKCANIYDFNIDRDIVFENWKPLY